jgi:hypothetical protein
MRQKNPAIMAEYRKRRNRQWVASGLILVLVLPNLIPSGRNNDNFRLFGLPENVTIAVFLAIVLGVVIFSLTSPFSRVRADR